MYQKDNLGNLRIITAPMEGVKSATVLVLVGTGSRFEDWRVNGIAHFAEHMFFKGTSKRPSALDISSLIDGVGGEFNAFTSKEYTGFYVKAASSHLELALDVLSDMLLNSRFDKAEIEREKEVILEELRMYKDMPTRYISNVYESLLFGNQPLGWDIVGHEESIKSITQKDFLDYLRTYYTAKNMVLGVAGDVTAANVRELATKYLSQTADKDTPTFPKYNGAQINPGLKLAYKETEQTHPAIGVRSYPVGHPKHYIVSVLCTVLGGPMSSRLFIELRERRGLGYYVRAGVDEYLDTGTLVVQAGVQKPKIDEAIKIILQELKKISEEKIPEAELNRAKEYLKGKLILELEDSRELAALYSMQETLEKKLQTPEQIISEIDSVTADQVKSVAKELIIQKHLNLALIGPYKEESKFLELLKL